MHSIGTLSTKTTKILEIHLGIFSGISMYNIHIQLLLSAPAICCVNMDTRTQPWTSNVDVQKNRSSAGDGDRPRSNIIRYNNMYYRYIIMVIKINM